MRVVVRIALAVSALVVVVVVIAFATAVHDIGEWTGEPGDNDFWLGVGFGLLASAVPLAFIWLAVFVVYVIAKGVRTLSR